MYRTITDKDECPALPNPANGQVLTTDTVYQSTAIYSCDTGYTLSGGQSTRTCQDNGQWNGSAPECDRGFPINTFII